MILSGSKDATLRDVQIVSIHGSEFFDITFSHDDEPGQLRRTRVGKEVVYANPRPGDAVSVSYLMNMPASIDRRHA